MLKRVQGADEAGLQVMIHAIGDEANYRILEIYKSVAASNGKRDHRFRIEHAQHLRATDIPRFGGQKVIASMQPYHAADDGRWCEKRIGAERSKGTYAFSTLLDTDSVLAFGSDWTVAPLNPLDASKPPSRAKPWMANTPMVGCQNKKSVSMKPFALTRSAQLTPNSLMALKVPSNPECSQTL